MTGKSKGFGFLAYEDQRSTVLAVDNLNGSEINKRPMRVDHCQNYKIPSEYLNMDDAELKEGETLEDKLYKPTGPDGKGWGEFRNLGEDDIKKLEDAEKSHNKTQPQPEGKEKDPEKKNVDKDLFILDEDERWEKMFRKQQEIDLEEEKMQSKEMQEEIERLRLELAQKNKEAKDKKKKKDKKHKKSKKHKKDKKEKKDKSHKRARLDSD